MSSSLNEPAVTAAETVLMALDGMPPDSLHALEAVIDGELESLILYRDALGHVRGWLNICPHAGRRLDYAPGQFLRNKHGELVCAVHGATFGLGDGSCVAGPCRGDRLREVALDCSAGAVRLAASR